MTKTRHPDLYFDKLKAGEWSFFCREDGDTDFHRVGLIYPSKQSLVWDMERYFNVYGWPEA